MRNGVRCLLAVLAVLCVVLPSILFASGPVTGTFKVVIVRVLYSDSPAGHAYTNAQMDTAMGEIHTFFSELSYGALDMQLSWRDVTLGHNRAYYWYACPASDDAGRYCVKDDLFRDAAEAAGAAGTDFTNVKTLTVLSPCGTYDRYANWTSGSDIDLNSAHVHRTVHKVSDTECSFTGVTPGIVNSLASGVWWGGWGHELGHTVQLEGHDMFNHPSGYASGYDLMDSCYPCGESVYSRSGTPVVSDESHTSFPEWLPSSKTLTIDRPTSGTAGGTYVLEPVSKLSPGSTVAYRGIKLPLGGGHYYMIDARVRVAADTHNVVPGLYDEGIQIQDIVESRNPPVQNIWSCNTTVVPLGCILTDTDSRIPTCHAAAKAGDQPDYCWPFPLFHPGTTWTDSTNNISVHVLSRLGDGYGVTVTRGVAPGHPDVYIFPWLTAPMNTYETVDIWVDSSCNGYEPVVGAAGLRYGRRGDGTVIGNGDDPCANHENKIFAHVRNGGDATAVNAHVHFLVTDPPGVGVRDASGWVEVGSVTIPSLAPGAAQDVSVNWTPHVTLSDAQIAEGHFNFHTCVQIIIDGVAGEVILSNQDGDGEQENFDHFEAVRDPVTHDYRVPDRDFYLFNHFMRHNQLTGAPSSSSGLPKHFQLRIKSDMPPDWSYEVAGGETELVLAPEEVRKVPVKVKVPPGTATAKTFFLRVTAFEQGEIINRMVPATSPARRHYGWHTVAGVVEAVQTVDPSTLTITAEYKCPESRPTVAVLPGVIHVKGHLDPIHGNTVVAIDYTPPGGGATQTHLVHTDSASNFEDNLPASASGEWLVRALWQGDMDHSSSVSDVVKVAASPRDCKPTSTPTAPTTPQTAPPNSVILVPDNAFPGGVLTGVVIGPDDQPVPNTPVEVAGGVPATLSGEVIGEPAPCSPNDPKCQPQKPTQTVLRPPVDCAALLQKIREAAVAPVPGQPNAPNQPSPANAPGSPAGGNNVVTDAAGRFALCVPTTAPTVTVNLPGNTKVPINPMGDQSPPPNQPPDFFQPGQKISLPGAIRDPKATQGGRTWLLPAVQAWSPDGQKAISAIKAPNDLKPGPAQLSYLDANGRPQQVQATVFKITRAFLDRSQLHSNQGATFEYEVQFAAPGQEKLCVEMHVAGPVVLVQAPAQVIPIDANGMGKFGGKIRATQVTPGAVVPFDLSPHIHVCGK
jgi:hypothetical protein